MCGCPHLLPPTSNILSSMLVFNNQSGQEMPQNIKHVNYFKKKN